MPTKFALLPYATTELLDIANAPAAADGTRLELSLDVEITADGAAQGGAISFAQALRGPGDIVAIDRSVVRRVEPAAGLRGFEPNYLPFVEFHDADFPWRYSPDRSAQAGRRHPWLALIVLKAGEFEMRDAGSAPLPSIEVRNAAASLPDPRQSWASAHVQLDLPSDGGQDVAGALRRDDNLVFSRLFATRRLEENSAYFMFLVPSYASGVEAGLGRRVQAPIADRAWDAASTAAVTLPVYMQWRFATDAAEDIELLMRRLRAFRADESGEAGAVKKASAERPGYYLDYSKEGAEFALQSAMAQPDHQLEPFDTDPDLAGRMSATLAQAIAGEQVDDDDEDPLVTFPAYGHRYKPDTTATLARARNNFWFDRINLDLKFRQAAGLGAQIVQKHQELFAHLCWLQFREISEANERLARLETADRLAASLNRRRFARLDSAVALTLGEPLQSVARASETQSLADSLAAKGVPLSFASRGLRRQAAKRGRTGGGKAAALPSPAIPGDRMAVTEAPTAAAMRAGAPAVGIGLSAEAPALFATLFKADAFEQVARPDVPVVQVAQFDSADLSQPMVAMLDRLAVTKARVTIAGLTEQETEKLQPVWRAPQIPLPLSTYLPQIRRDAMLSNADAMADNTVGLFIENRAFVEALLVGANHEMNNELRWREFPTDLRGTIFKRFWDRHLAQQDPAGDDIAEIHSWRGTLGSHFPPLDDDNKANVIVVVRGDIVRKLRDPILVINIATGTTWTHGSGEDHSPVFSGTIGRDIAYWGFDIARDTLLSNPVRDRAFLVIYEAAGQLRFGMDVGTAAVRAARADLRSRRYAIPMQSLSTTFRQASPKVLTAPQAAPAVSTKADDLSWSHARLTTSGHIDFSANIQIADPPGLWGSSKTSASVARAMWQKPVAAVLPLKRVL